MNYLQFDDHSEDCPSAMFEDDEKYCDLMDDLIESLDECTLHNFDMQVEGPYQTRILLDWLCETRRRFYINKKLKQNLHK